MNLNTIEKKLATKGKTLSLFIVERDLTGHLTGPQAKIVNIQGDWMTIETTINGTKRIFLNNTGYMALEIVG